MQIRQGDILLVKIDALPAGLKPAERDKLGRVVLAVGEAHDHAHAIHDKNVLAFLKEGSESLFPGFIEVGGSAVALKHETSDGKKADHNTAVVEPGTYKVIQQREQSDEGVDLRAFD